MSSPPPAPRGSYIGFQDIHGYEIRLGHDNGAFMIQIGGMIAMLDGTAQLSLYSWLLWHIAVTAGPVDGEAPWLEGAVNDGGAITEALSDRIDTVIRETDGC